MPPPTPRHRPSPLSSLHITFEAMPHPTPRRRLSPVSSLHITIEAMPPPTHHRPSPLSLLHIAFEAMPHPTPCRRFLRCVFTTHYTLYTAGRRRQIPHSCRQTQQNGHPQTLPPAPGSQARYPFNPKTRTRAAVSCLTSESGVSHTSANHPPCTHQKAVAPAQRLLLATRAAARTDREEGQEEAPASRMCCRAGARR
jgi:hypothetical protein